jgi:hypothetical protein
MAFLTVFLGWEQSQIVNMPCFANVFLPYEVCICLLHPCTVALKASRRQCHGSVPIIMQILVPLARPSDRRCCCCCFSLHGPSGVCADDYRAIQNISDEPIN